MNKFTTLIVVLALLALAGFSLFFLNQKRLSQKEAQLAEQTERLSQEQAQMLAMEESLRQKELEGERLARQAKEAREMAEALAEKERLEREKLVAELNARLAREAEERRLAEEAQKALEEKMLALQAAQVEAQAALARLEQQRTAEGATDADSLREKIASQQQELVSLSSENEQLRARQQLLEQRQIATEEAILEAGGRVEIPYPEIRSPNVKRREAIYFKERVLGNPGG